AQQIWQCAEAVPPEWYGSDFEALERLIESLVMRRARVRALITEFRHSSRQPFPHWTAAEVVIGHA
ncbi:MAG: phosphatidylinositol kinase, partial [Acidobacteriia bacterium]|nr:phosphatidylinositol kinase [Terriglobia bacterium]